MANRKEIFSNATIDGLLAGRKPGEVFAKDGLFDDLKKALANRMLKAELDEHMKGEALAGRRNHRKGRILSFYAILHNQRIIKCLPKPTGS